MLIQKDDILHQSIHLRRDCSMLRKKSRAGGGGGGGGGVDRMGLK
jgi:hypothetical protein